MAFDKVERGLEDRRTGDERLAGDARLAGDTRLAGDARLAGEDRLPGAFLVGDFFPADAAESELSVEPAIGLPGFLLLTDDMGIDEFLVALTPSEVSAFTGLLRVNRRSLIFR